MDTASHESSGEHLVSFFYFSFLDNFWIFRRPCGAVGADDRVSRRDRSVSAGRVGPRSAARGPGDIWELFSEVGFFGEIFLQMGSRALVTCRVH